MQSSIQFAKPSENGEAAPVVKAAVEEVAVVETVVEETAVVSDVKTVVEDTVVAADTGISNGVVAGAVDTVVVDAVEENTAGTIGTVVETVVEDEGEEVEADVDEIVSSVAYTADMPVEDICSMMTVEEAGNVIVPIGTCKDWTMSQVADRRPASLKWYINGYSGNDNILRAAATIMQSTLDLQKAS